MSETPSNHHPRRSIEIVPDADSLATRAAEWLVGQIAHAIEKRGRAVVALSGGSTPKAVFACLADAPWRDRIAWDAVHVVWGDERFVPEGDPASNVTMAREALLDHVDVAASHVYPVPSDIASSDVATGNVEATFERARTAADLYATSLHAIYGGHVLHDERPLFDVVMLGLGDDGHTASLFPGTPALDERSAWVVAVRTSSVATSETAPVRVTLTYPVLESSHAVLFLVAGDGKRAILRRVLDGDTTLPAARVDARGGTLWIIDKAAAGEPA